MDYKTTAGQIKQGHIAPLYVCYGSEKYLIQEFRRYLIEHAVAAQERDAAVTVYDMRETTLDEILDDAGTLPFLAERKLIIAEEAYFLTASPPSTKLVHQPERLLAYLQSPAEFTTLLFIVPAEKLDERKKLVKQLKAADTLLAFEELKGQQLQRWLQAEAKKQGVTLAADATERLIAFAGGSLQQLQSELGKLVMYKGKGNVVEQRDVELMVARSAEQSVFLMIEEAIRLRLDRALAILAELLRLREEPVKITMLLARQFRMMLQVKMLNEQGIDSRQAASRIGQHPYAVKLAGEQAAKYSSSALAAALNDLSELDYQMKTGKIDKVIGLERFILKLATRLERARF